MASYTTNVKPLYVDIRARSQRVSDNLDQTRIFPLYLTIFNSVVPGHFDAAAVGCQSYYCQFKHMYILWFMYINVDAVGVETINVNLKCIFYGKFKHDKILVP